jgi:leucyl-tRNA synthetase
MIAVNDLKKMNCNKSAILKDLIVVMAPFAPFVTEELWQRLGGQGSIHQAAYPEFNEDYLKEDSIEYPISINGKKRASAEFPADASKDELEKAALSLEAIQKWTEGKTIRKVIVVPKRMINIVVG